jgi:hypothetical protein
MADDRFDVTPKQCCFNCRHLFSNDNVAGEQCLRDDFEQETFRYEWDNVEDMFDVVRKSCSQWESE